MVQAKRNQIIFTMCVVSSRWMRMIENVNRYGSWDALDEVLTSSARVNQWSNSGPWHPILHYLCVRSAPPGIYTTTPAPARGMSRLFQDCLDWSSSFTQSRRRRAVSLSSQITLPEVPWQKRRDPLVLREIILWSGRGWIVLWTLFTFPFDFNTPSSTFFRSYMEMSLIKRFTSTCGLGFR